MTVLLAFVEEVGECVVDVMTYLRPVVYIALGFKEVEVALGEVAGVGKALGVAFQRVDERYHVAVSDILRACSGEDKVIILGITALVYGILYARIYQ